MQNDIPGFLDLAAYFKRIWWACVEILIRQATISCRARRPRGVNLGGPTSAIRPPMSSLLLAFQGVSIAKTA
jgi:hypothetical protein